MSGAFRALKMRNYRLFFSGQVLSLIGSWMETVAMSWLIYRITGSELLLGTVAFSSQIPAFIMSPFAGIVADKHDRRRLLMITQSLLAVEAFVLAFLVLSGLIQPWHVIVTSVFVGVVTAFDMPTRQALVPALVEDKNILSNAIALNSAQFNIARLIGPAVAGVTVAAVGEGWCFLINGFSFGAVLFALAAMRLQPTEGPAITESALARVKAGALYAWNHRAILYLLQLMAILSFVAGVYAVMLPVLTIHVFHAGAGIFGLLYSAVAVGSLVAGFLLAIRPSVLGLGRWVLRASIAFNLGLIGLALSPVLGFGLVALVVMGFGMMMHMGSTNTMIQTVVKDEMRGRVMSFYMMSFVGMMPIGSFLAGLLAERIGPHWTLGGAAAIGLLGSLIYALRYPEMRRVLRPIYEDMGILEPVL